PTPICFGQPMGYPCDDGLFCNGSDECNGSGGCTLHPTPAPCDDGDPCTTDTCTELAHCQHQVTGESRACRTCLHRIDKDGDGNTAAEDSGCATLSAEQHFAVIGRNTSGKSVAFGTIVTLASAAGSMPSSTAPFPLGPSHGGACGETMAIFPGNQIA